MTADQPLSENGTVRRGVGGGLVVISKIERLSCHKIFEYMLKSFRTLSLSSEGKLRGTDYFYFILITFSFKLEMVLINRVI